MRSLISHVLTGFNCSRCGRPGTRAYRYDTIGRFGSKCIKRVSEFHDELGDQYYDHVALKTVEGEWRYSGLFVRSSRVAAWAMCRDIEKVVVFSKDVYAELRKEWTSMKPAILLHPAKPGGVSIALPEDLAPLFERYEARGETIRGR